MSEPVGAYVSVDELKTVLYDSNCTVPVVPCESPAMKVTGVP